mgnify:CR=1 FL=1|jgi:hypothetical protein
MALLTALTVDDLDSLSDGALCLVMMHDFHRVYRTDERIFSRLRLPELLDCTAGLVCDESSDFASLVGVRLLEHGHREELMRWQVLIEPFQRVVGTLLPVTVASAD